MNTTAPLLFMLVLICNVAVSQVSINNTGNSPDNSAMLDVQSNAKGFLLPRLSTAQRDAVSNPATGLMIFDTDDNTFYFYNGSVWEAVNGTSDNDWMVSGNDIYSGVSGNVGVGTGTPQGKLHVFTQYSVTNYTSDLCTGGTATASSNSSNNIAENAFDDNNDSYWENTGSFPSWLRYDFGESNKKTIVRYRINYNLSDLDHAPKNWRFQGSDDATTWTTLDTKNAEIWLTQGWKEYDITNTTSFRYYRLLIFDNKGTADNIVSISEVEMMESYTTINDDNTLFVNEGNIGIGTVSPTAKLHINGSFRLEDGSEGLGKLLVSDINGNASWTVQTNIDDGDWNVFGNHIYTLLNDSVGIGVPVPGSNLDVFGRIWISNTGHSVFIGENAGANDNFTNNYNVFVGYQSGQENTDGNTNTGVATLALHQNTTGNGNSAFGYLTLFSNTEGNNNTAIGDSALYYNETGYDNTAIGHKAFVNGTNYHNSTALGNEATVTGSNQIRFGNTNVTSIGGYVGYTTLTNLIALQYVKATIPGLEFILKLKPVAYQYHTKTGKIFTGFIPREVETAASETGTTFSGIDQSDDNKEIYGIRYSAFVVPLVKAIQEQQKIIEQQQKQIDMLQKRVKKLEGTFYK